MEVPWCSLANIPHPQFRGPRFDPGWGTRPHVPQLRVHMLRWYNGAPHTASEARCSQITKENEWILRKKECHEETYADKSNNFG